MAHFRRPEQPLPGLDATSAARKQHEVNFGDSMDALMGFDRFDSGKPREGWLVNFQPTTIDLMSDEAPQGKSAVDFYFLDGEGGYFKSTVQFDPYFYIHCHGREEEVNDFLRKKLGDTIKFSTILTKEDLSLPNHLLGRKSTLILLKFWNVSDLLTARKALSTIIATNAKKGEFDAESLETVSVPECIHEFREQDVPYHVRVVIDMDIRVGKWYNVAPALPGSINNNVVLTELDNEVRADPVVMAFDIETTKLPLKFPDSKHDQVMMISYMIDGNGFLITNREIVSEDIEDFEYTPKPEFPGHFTIFNEANEKETLHRFFEHVREEKPTVIATFNGDGFDWPFVCARAAVHGMDMKEEIGFEVDAENEFKSKHCVHMDCFRWVKRDSYLPQGSQGLKAVTTAKLGYTPLEIDPELMTPYASQKPQVLAEYSVSDAVATYYLYMKYVHPFIFSLCTIIPLRPDEVLRKGTGTLCEMLLMVQAYIRNIVLPHKHSDPPERYFDGHLVESETYVGGHVESLEAGVFRADIPTHFTVETSAIDELLAQLDDALKFTIVTELKMDLSNVKNYETVKKSITDMLMELKLNPKRMEEPLIYHVDVASMYPNIMTSNRLQPDSMKTERDCAMCDFNTPDKTCDRRLPWAWRGEFFPAKKDEILTIQKQLREERFPLPKDQTPATNNGKSWRDFDSLSQTEQLALQKQRISDYSRKVYHRLRESQTIEKEAIICQRENPFYVNTVRDFRDRRYDFKGKQKVWKQNLGKAKSAEDKEHAGKMVVLYDSLQLAHKVILNSFYGYVMRKGSRWYSMEMAGVTCLTGATIIQLARSMVERLGRPLELDTDGIWCILPKSFPGDLEFELQNGKTIPFAYPCVMLNHLVHEKFTNHQYQTLVDEANLRWETSSDNTIFFEVDGPYKAMMLPSSREEGKGLKKRYAVFNYDGSLAELKGFEMKRRGELQLIKTFQTQLFSQFLKGGNLKECYAAVAKIANSWLDVLDSKGKTLEDVDLMNLISENKSMSKSLDEYGGLKSSSISTARRLGDFLGREMVKDKGLACRFIISSEPAHEPVTNRAIPVQIFEAPRAKQEEFLRKWLKKPHLDDFDPRNIIDWKYYRERLAATIQKLIVIPAARQNIPNPVPRVPPPQWLIKKLANESDTMKQQTIGFSKTTRSDALWGGSSDSTLVGEEGSSPEIEDLPGTLGVGKSALKKAVFTKRKTSSDKSSEESKEVEEVSIDLAPSPDVDYVGWLVYMKRVWAKQREQRNARHQLFGGTARRSRGIQGLLRQQTESAWRGGGGVWQLIQVAPTADPGKLRVVALVNSRLQTVNVVVQREVLVLLREQHSLPSLSDGITAEQTPDLILPSNHTSNQLWKLTMSERKYQDEMVRAGGIFKSKAIEKVYEDHISAIDRVLLKLGRYCQLSNTMGLLGKGLDTGFELDWLSPVDPSIFSDSKKPGKADLTADLSTWKSFDYLFVQHYEVHGRHVLVLLPTWSSELHVLELTPRKSAGVSEADWSSYASSEYTSQFSYHMPEQPFFDFPESIRVVNGGSQKFETPQRFWTTANKAIASLLGQKPRSAVSVVSCDRGVNWLSVHLRTLAESSVVNLGDSTNAALPSIGWEHQLARRVVKTFLRSQYTLDSIRVTVNHANIPMCNLPSVDDVRPIIDVIYARKLHQSKNVLWWGENTDNASSSALNYAPLSSQQSLVIPANTKLISGSEGNTMGKLYPHVCFDVSISNLIVNTILTSSYLQLAEGSEQADPDFVVGAFSPSAWKCLVSLTKEWWSKASAGDVASDVCIQQLAGWVASPSSRLWSSSLSHQINTLSKKALNQLLRELRKLGTQVVYAERDGQRIVLATTKKSAINAVPFGGLIVKEAKNKEMFTYLDISVNEVWDFIIWMDPANYGGRLLGPADNLEYVASWHIAEFLPPILYDEFEECVSEFMTLIGERKDRFTGTDVVSDISSAGNGSAPLTNGEQAPSRQYNMGIPANFMEGSFVQFERRLLNRVRQLHNRRIESMARKEHDNTFEMPQRAGSTGSKQSRESPVLSFVKTLLSVYALVRDDVGFIQLRRSLLALLDVGDFDASSQFKNPSAKLTVPNVICGGCMACVDVDVCRPESADLRKFIFMCPQCGVELDRVMLEELLVQMLVSAVAQYQMQDLQCTKCGKIRPSDMAEYCPCSGQFKNSITQESILSSLSVYRQVGKYYDLRLLNDSIAQY